MDKCKLIQNAQKRRKELLDLGLFCTIIGPRGPKGEGINIIDYYKSEDELLDRHPVGKTGDAYLVNSNIFIWSENDGVWKDAGSIKGEKGDKGDQGEQGLQGVKGDKGDKGDNGADGISPIVRISNTTGEWEISTDNGLTYTSTGITAKGEKGDKGDKGDTGEVGPKGENGEDGNCEIIDIVDTKTLDAGQMAKVTDNFSLNTHHLTIAIPKGDKGDVGPTGPQGPIGPIMEGSTEGMLFASFAETNISGLMNIQDTHIIPTDSEFFKINGRNDIIVSPGVYEIAFSGAIEEVDSTHGGIFYVKDDAGQVVMDLSFKLSGGVVPQMHFSQNIVFEFKKDTTLQVMAGIIGDAASSRIKINDVNLLLKKIYV